MSDCIFCDILAGKLTSSVVSKDDMCWAFMDIQPVNPGHILVVPAFHVSSLAELHPELGAHMFKTAQRIAKALRRTALKCEGINFFLADGRVAGQDILHVHLHVIPRHRGDGFGLKLGSSYGYRPPRDELDMVAAEIKRVLG